MSNQALVGDLKNELRFAGSYSRLPVLLKYRYLVPDDAWLGILGREWPLCDNVSLYLDELLASPFGERLGQAIMPMMSRQARKVYADLPDVVTVYRGCYASNRHGFSWSLDREVAERFPLLVRYRQDGQPLLVKARIEKSKIAAVITDRNESEVICWRPRHVSTSCMPGAAR